MIGYIFVTGEPSYVYVLFVLSLMFDALYITVLPFALKITTNKSAEQVEMDIRLNVCYYTVRAT